MTGQKGSFNLEIPGNGRAIPPSMDFLTMVLFAIHVGPPGGLQALRTDCSLVRHHCGPDGVCIRNACQPKETLVCKPRRFHWQAATPTQ
jgi:hypothetical protein